MRPTRLITNRRLMSTLTPREVVIQNAVRLQAVSAAQNEAELEAALKSRPVIDKKSEEFKDFFSAAQASPNQKFIPNPKAWQNLPYGDYVAEEVSRAETWPFFVGGG